MAAATTLEVMQDMDGALAVLAEALATFAPASPQHTTLADHIHRVCGNAVVFAQQRSEYGNAALHRTDECGAALVRLSGTCTGWPSSRQPTDCQRCTPLSAKCRFFPP